MTLNGHTSGFRGVALSADGRLVAGGIQDGTVMVWETAGGQLLADLEGSRWCGPPRRAFMGWESACQLRIRGPWFDCGMLLAASHWLPYRATPAQSGHRTVRRRTPCGQQRRGRDGTPVGAGATNSSQRSAATPPPSRGLRFHEMGVVASTATTGSYDLAGGTGQTLRTLRGHAGAVWCVALSGDGQLVASGGWDSTVRLWESGWKSRSVTSRAHWPGVGRRGLGRWATCGQWRRGRNSAAVGHG